MGYAINSQGGARAVDSPENCGLGEVYADAIPVAPLSVVKAQKDAEINAARLVANQSTFSYGGKLIACDDLSMRDITGTNGEVNNTGALPAGWPGGWKAIDNTYVSIPDVATWHAFYSAMVAQGVANFVHAQQLKAQVAAATDIATVEAIQW